MQYVDPARQFVKDSIRLVNKCTKPDRKGMFCFAAPENDHILLFDRTLSNQEKISTSLLLTFLVLVVDKLSDRKL